MRGCCVVVTPHHPLWAGKQLYSVLLLRYACSKLAVTMSVARRVWTTCCIKSTGDTGGQAAAEQPALGLRPGHLLVEDDTVMRAAAGGMNVNGRNFLRGGGIQPSQWEPYHL
jgi:hypothetical protein